MAAKKKLDPVETTPLGHLAEASLHQIVGYQIAQAGITTDAVFTEQVGKPMALRRVEYTILKLISENPGCSAARLARALAVTAPNLTVWIDKLVDRRWVVREQNLSDRRSQHLHLSPAGVKLVADATHRLLSGEQHTLVGLSPGERALLIELLHKIACMRTQRDRDQ